MILVKIPLLLSIEKNSFCYIKPIVKQMSKLLFIGLMFLTLISFAQDKGVIILEGHYQGVDLYVQNPYGSSGVGFCAYKVTINDNVTTDQVESSAFIIDFTTQGLKVGDEVTVKIFHKTDCQPKVLNPEVLRPKSTFETKSIEVTDKQVLKWVTTGEQGKLTFQVEQYRWNRYIKIGEVEGEGTASENSYEFKITPTSGENKFRVVQVDYTGKKRMSPKAAYQSSTDKISLVSAKSKTLDFSGETLFEVYDTYGNLVKKGFGKNPNVENLQKGLYYVNYDAQTGVVWNKK